MELDKIWRAKTKKRERQNREACAIVLARGNAWRFTIESYIRGIYRYLFYIDALFSTFIIRHVGM